MKKALAILATMVAFLTTACVPPPEFVASLSDPGSAGYDKRVPGHWYQLLGSDVILHAGVYGSGDGAGKKLEISLVAQRKGSVDVLRFVAFPSLVDGELYYNLVRTQLANTTDYTGPGEKPGHIIVRPFHLTPDIMMVCVLLWQGGVVLWEPEDPEGAITRALKGTGLTPRFHEDPPLRVNGRPKPGRSDVLYTLVDGSRDDLLRLVRKDPGSYFRPAFLLTRLGKPWPDPEKDPELKARMLAHGHECNMDRL